jgi:hypothetical protein
MERGMSQPLASEVAAQITSGTTDVRRLMELGAQGREAKLIEAAIIAHTVNVASMSECGIPGPLINEIAAQVI